MLESLDAVRRERQIKRGVLIDVMEAVELHGIDDIPLESRDLDLTMDRILDEKSLHGYRTHFAAATSLLLSHW